MISIIKNNNLLTVPRQYMCDYFNNNILPLTNEIILNTIFNKKLSDDYELIDDNNMCVLKKIFDFQEKNDMSNIHINDTNTFSLLIEKCLLFDKNINIEMINKLFMKIKKEIIFEYFSLNKYDKTSYLKINDMIIDYCINNNLFDDLIYYLIINNNLDKIKFIYENKKNKIDYNHLEFALKNNNLQVSKYLINNKMNDFTKMNLNEIEYKTFRRINKSIIENENMKTLSELKQENETLKNEINEIKNNKLIKFKLTKGYLYKYKNSFLLITSETMKIYNNQMNLINDLSFYKNIIPNEVYLINDSLFICKVGTNSGLPKPTETFYDDNNLKIMLIHDASKFRESDKLDPYNKYMPLSKLKVLFYFKTANLYYNNNYVCCFTCDNKYVNESITYLNDRYVYLNGCNILCEILI